MKIRLSLAIIACAGFRSTRRNKIAVVMGYSERVGGSRYLAQVFIDEDGEIVAIAAR